MGAQIRIRAGDGAGKIARRERRQIVDALADADEVHRHGELRRDRDENAAARGAVELGHGEAGDAHGLAEDIDLRQRILADGGVEHQQHRMRRRRIDLLHHANDLVQLVHQLGAVLQAAGGVDEQHVDAAFLRRAQRVEDETGGVAAGFPRDESRAGALAPDLELVDGGGAEGVAGRQHHGAAFGAELGRELADGRGLAGAVDPDDEDDEGLLRRIDGERLRHAGERLLDLRGHHRLDLLR